METDILLSIVIPVYNVQNYIGKCLNSLKTLDGRIEILVVDDGSPDDSCEVIKNYVKDNSNVHYIKKENGGVSSARNLGIALSKGKYITFGINERKDCWKWIDYISERFGTEHEIFLGGLSLGASTVVMASGKPLPAQVKGIIADSPFTSPYDIISRTVSHKYHAPSGILMPVICFWSRCLAKISLREYSTLQAMETNETPILFVHGKMDDYVPWKMSVQTSEACRPYHELFLVDGADHGTGYMVEPELYREKLTAFFRYCSALN